MRGGGRPATRVRRAVASKRLKRRTSEPSCSARRRWRSRRTRPSRMRRTRRPWCRPPGGARTPPCGRWARRPATRRPASAAARRRCAARSRAGRGTEQEEREERDPASHGITSGERRGCAGGLAWFRPDAPPERGSTGGEWPHGASLGLAVAAGEMRRPAPVEWANPEVTDDRCRLVQVVHTRSGARAAALDHGIVCAIPGRARPRHCSARGALTIEEGHKLRLALRLAGVTQARAARVLDARQTQLSAWMALGKGPDDVCSGSRRRSASGPTPWSTSVRGGAGTCSATGTSPRFAVLRGLRDACVGERAGRWTATGRGEERHARLRQLRKVRGGPGAAAARAHALGQGSDADQARRSARRRCSSAPSAATRTATSCTAVPSALAGCALGATAVIAASAPCPETDARAGRAVPAGSGAPGRVEGDRVALQSRKTAMKPGSPMSVFGMSSVPPAPRRRSTQASSFPRGVEVDERALGWRASGDRPG